MKTLLVIIMSLCLHVTYAQKPDTTKTFIQGKELGEVVVKSSYLTREGDHILAIPTKEQRKHAVTGYDLLSNLMIPGVSVERSTAIQLSDSSNSIDRALTMLPELVEKLTTLVKKDAKAPAEEPKAE